MHNTLVRLPLKIAIDPRETILTKDDENFEKEKKDNHFLFYFVGAH